MKNLIQCFLAVLCMMLCTAAFAQWNTNGANVVYTLDRVGIGTTSPQNKLEVSEGNIIIKSDIYAHFGIERGNGGRINLGVTSNTKQAFMASAGEIKFLTDLENNDASSKMFINRQGNVGIATTSPNYRLDINGTARAKEIRVQTGWSDYVFLPDYQLPTLKEEEQHIQQNGHLLGFESEGTMEGEVQLGDVTKRQQAKLEEMMLHMIEMNKELQQLKVRNEELEKEVQALKQH